MRYRLVYTRSAVKDIKKLDTLTRKKLKRKIELNSKSPISNSKKLSDPKLGMYRWRAGNYRVVFDVVGKDIVILRVRHRKEVYRI